MSALRVSALVAAAFAAGRPVVAFESSGLAHGLPVPANREAATRMATAVIESGATPAITAVLGGACTLGLLDSELERILLRDGMRKLSARDLPVAIAQGADGATTVAGSLCIAGAAGCEVFATGGIGGVHRDAPFDESADLAELARTPMVVVCAGAKSILDLSATLERLETLGVTVVGFQTDELPGFFTRSTGLPVGARAESASEIAAIFRMSRALGRRQAVLVVQPPPADVALPAAAVDEAVQHALAEAQRSGIQGPALTPFLLKVVGTQTGGRSLQANLGLLEQNAVLAGRIAVELASSARS